MTPREQRVLDVVRGRIEHTGLAPTISEIAAALGRKGRASAHQALSALVEAGLLLREPHLLRGLRLPGVPDLGPVPTAMLRAELARRSEA